MPRKSAPRVMARWPILAHGADRHELENPQYADSIPAFQPRYPPLAPSSVQNHISSFISQRHAKVLTPSARSRFLVWSGFGGRAADPGPALPRRLGSIGISIDPAPPKRVSVCGGVLGTEAAILRKAIE